jgi:hypothetical protein
VRSHASQMLQQWVSRPSSCKIQITTMLKLKRLVRQEVAKVIKSNTRISQISLRKRRLNSLLNPWSQSLLAMPMMNTFARGVWRSGSAKSSELLTGRTRRKNVWKRKKTRSLRVAPPNTDLTTQLTSRANSCTLTPTRLET